MLLALAWYASAAHATTPRYDLDLLYHDGRAQRLDKRSSVGLFASAHSRRARTRRP